MITVFVFVASNNHVLTLPCTVVRRKVEYGKRRRGQRLCTKPEGHTKQHALRACLNEKKRQPAGHGGHKAAKFSTLRGFREGVPTTTVFDFCVLLFHRHLMVDIYFFSSRHDPVTVGRSFCFMLRRRRMKASVLSTVVLTVPSTNWIFRDDDAVDHVYPSQPGFSDHVKLRASVKLW